MLNRIEQITDFARRSTLLTTLARRIRAEKEAAGAFRASAFPPILIYQMGKVGSSGVYNSLRKSNLSNPLLSLHFVGRDLSHLKKEFDAAGIVPLPYHVFLGEAVGRRLERHPEATCKIISLVRDPIAITVSDLYQNPAFAAHGDLFSSGSEIIDSEKAVRYLEEKLSHEKTFDYINGWFDRELKRVFGIDVFKMPFPVDIGHEIYRAGNAEALIIRLEDLSNLGAAAISAFLDLPNPIEIKPGNIRRESLSGDSYQRTNQALRLSSSLCERIYSSDFVRHFYSKAMIDHFIGKWSAGTELL